MTIFFAIFIKINSRKRTTPDFEDLKILIDFDRRAIAESSGPGPRRAPEGGDQIRKFLEEWQQKYKESEERYRAERDEA
jgi:hypothetical protein